MRLRKLHNASQILNNNKLNFINNPSLIDKDWSKVFDNNHDLELEIGMGKGEFIINKSLQNNDINFIGLELNETICAKAIKKINTYDKNINNLRIINFNAQKLLEIFDKNSISKIYLNFSDPWTKARHEKNRLTSPKFLDIYKVVLKKDSLIEFKTDNDGLYKYTLEILNSRNDVTIIYKTDNIYNELDNGFNKYNIQTEYEKKFVSQGKNINKIIFKFQ